MTHKGWCVVKPQHNQNPVWEHKFYSEWLHLVYMYSKYICMTGFRVGIQNNNSHEKRLKG